MPGAFSPEFQADFDTVGEEAVWYPTIPAPDEYRLNCPEIELLTGADANNALGTIKNYIELDIVADTYTLLHEEFSDYADIMSGHPGFSSGPPAPGSGGRGLHLGIVDTNYVEWWVTDVEGWDTGPTVEPVEVTSLDHGTWIDVIRGRGREVVIRGAILSLVEPGEQLEAAKRKLTAAVASPPFFALLRVGGLRGLRLPVVLTEPVKTKHLSDVMVEFEMTVKGHNVGTPGLGVWREGQHVEYWLDSTDSAELTNEGGHVIGRPLITMVGPLTAGLELTDGTRTMTLAENLGNNELLTIDCATWRVSLDGTPARGMLTQGSGRLEIDPAVTTLTTTGTGEGSIRVSVTDLH